MAFLLSLITFIILISVLVFVHELGHFAVAKWVGMRVDEFAIGFPPRVKSVRRGETTYSLNAIPFGGYVRIHGEGGSEDGEVDPRAFDQRPVLARIAVILAGITMNVLLAFVALTIAFSVGFNSISQDLTSVPGATVTKDQVLIADVLVGGPGDKAGVKSGDLLVTAGGVGITKLDDLVARGKNLQATGVKTDVLSLNRDGKIIDLTVNIGLGGGAAYGLGIQSLQTVRVPVWRAPQVAVKEIWAILRLTWNSLADFGTKLFGHAKLDPSVTGPVGIYQATATAAQTGFAQVIFLMVVLSLNLALLNLLPIPALDGGKFLFLLIELIFRRRVVSHSIERWLVNISFLLVIGLMLVLTARDVIKLL